MSRLVPPANRRCGKGLGAGLIKTPFIETLEARRLLSVTQDAQGWTQFTQSPGARTVYVSSSAGNNRNSGLVSTRPVQTLAKARSLLRDGKGDWMLLKAGDVWYENLAGWGKSGLSKEFPLVISSYGKGERPVLETGAKDGFSAYKDAINHIAINGILFHANTRDPDSPDFKSTDGGYGLHTLVQVDDLQVENCVFDSYVYNLSIQGTYGPASHIGLRRNLVLDAYTDSVKAMGLYMSHASSVLIEGNVFDHNGWNEKIPGAGGNMFSHNIYLDESNTDVYVRGNIISAAGSHGLQARGGGTIQGNLFLNNPIGLLFGNGRDARAGGVQGDVSGNVFLGTGTIAGAARGWALEIGNLAPSGQTVVASNIFAQDQLGDNAAIVLSTGDGIESDPTARTGINNLTLEGNIVYRWNQGLSIKGNLVPGGTGADALNGLIVRNNDFQRLYSNKIIAQGREYDAAAERFSGNRYFNSGDSSKWFSKGGSTTSWDAWYTKVDKSSARVKVKYNDPERRIETYNATLGGRPTQGAFMTQVRLMARRIWDPRYTAEAVTQYMQAGFKVRKIPPVVTATNLSSRNTGPTSSQIFFLFDKDVSKSLSAGDLKITDVATRKAIKSSAMKLTYDAATNQATWTFPGLSSHSLKAGTYEVTLSGVSDLKGTPLDGDADGAVGGDFTRRLKIKSRA